MKKFEFFSQKNLYFFILVILTIICYFNVFYSDFVNWDDNIYVFENKRVLKGLNWENVLWAFSTNYFGFYYPITWLSHMLDVSLFGLKAPYHHLTSLILHILNSFLIFTFFERILKNINQAFLISLLFAIHPQNVESVVWISERKNLLGGFFFFLALIYYERFLSTEKFSFYISCYISYFLGLISKPILLTFPFSVLLLDFHPFKKLKLTMDFYKENKNLILQKIPFLIMFPIFIIITFIAQKKADAVQSLKAIPLDQRLIQATIAIKDYLFDFLLPLNLSPIYPHLKGNFNILDFLFSLLILSFIIIISLITIKKEPLIFVGLFFFLFNLSPVIGIIQVGEQGRADRYMYVPMIGLLYMAICLLSKVKFIRKFSIIFILFYISFFSYLTFNQTKVWKNTETLFGRVLKYTDKSSIAYHNLAKLERERGNIEKAIKFYEKAIEIEPCKAKSLTNLGAIYAEMGDLEKAEKLFLKAISCNPNFSQPFYNLGLLYSQKGDFLKAIEYYEKSIELNPYNANSYNNIGTCLIKIKEKEKALPYFKKAYELDKENISIVLNYALYLLESGNISQSKMLLKESLNKNKENLKLRKILLSIYLKERNLSEARELALEGLKYSDDEELKMVLDSLK